MPSFTELYQAMASLPRIDLTMEFLFMLILLIGLFGVCLFIAIPIRDNEDVKALSIMLLVMITFVLYGWHMAKREFLPSLNFWLVSLSRNNRIISGFSYLGLSFIGIVGVFIILTKLLFYWLHRRKFYTRLIAKSRKGETKC